MIRSILSFCALFGSLILISKWLHESSSPQPRETTARPAPAVEAAPASATTSADKPGPQTTGEQNVATKADAPARSAWHDHQIMPQPLWIVPQQALATADAGIRLVVYHDEPAIESGSGRTSASAAGGDVEPTGPSASLLPSSEPAIVLTPELAELRVRLRECLAYYYFRPENVALRSPWGAMHAMIAYGVDTDLIVGSRRVNAIGYLCYNGVCNGQQLFYTSGGKLQARIGPGVQGHPGQFLAMLAQSRVKKDFPIQVDGQNFTVADLIEHEKETCRPATELTFKLIAFTHYLTSEERWRASDGQIWDIPRLIQEELAQPIVGATCGGTHRMMGFSYAVRKRQQRSEPLTGQWLRAKKFVDDFHEYAFKLQNPDGSFSTDWFAGRNDFGPIGKRLETTGHIAEWLAFSLSKEQLVEPRMVKSVSYLTNLLSENRQEKWGIGPLGHGLHALAIYDERIFGGKPGMRAQELAGVKKQSRIER